MNQVYTDAQVKAQLIQRINTIKSEAIALGYDYPTQSPEEASINELIDFLVDVSEFIGYELGYNEATHNADGIW